MSKRKQKKYPWQTYYEIATKYFEKHGNINFDINYTENGLPLGRWLAKQRKHYKKNNLKQEIVIALERINIEWDGLNVRRQKWENQWKEIYKLAKNYFEENGDLLVHSDYKIEGVNLGQWLINLRATYKGKNRLSISQERIQQLNAIGMVWDYNIVIEAEWNRNYELAHKFYCVNGHLRVPQDYIFEGKALGTWIHTQRQAYKGNRGTLTHSKLEKLNEIGMVWNPYDESWEQYYSLATKYYELIGNLNVPDDYEMEEYNLGRWISVQRQAYNGRQDVKLTSEQIMRLNSIGMLWSGKNRTQTSFFEQAIFYYCKQCFKDTINKFTDNGFEIDIYIPSLKIGIEYDGEFWHKDKYIEDNHKDDKCNELGIKLIRIREFPLEKTTGAINYILQNYKHNIFSNLLNQIFKEQIGGSRDIDLKRDSIEILKCFKTSASDPWNINFELAKEYYQTNGNLLVHIDYTTSNGVRLGKWIAAQRQAYKGQSLTSFLTQEKIDKLNEIEMVWDKNEYDWNVAFEYARVYFLTNDNLNIPQRYEIHNFKLGKWINSQRNAYNGNKGTISKERIEKLNEIGMVWKTKEVRRERKNS